MLSGDGGAVGHAAFGVDVVGVAEEGVVGHAEVDEAGLRFALLPLLDAVDGVGGVFGLGFEFAVDAALLSRY